MVFASLPISRLDGVGRRAAAVPISRLLLVSVGADHFSVVLRPQSPPCRITDATLDELDGAVSEEHIGSAWMVAAGRIAEAVVGEIIDEAGSSQACSR